MSGLALQQRKSIFPTKVQYIFFSSEVRSSASSCTSNRFLAAGMECSPFMLLGYFLMILLIYLSIVVFTFTDLYKLRLFPDTHVTFPMSNSGVQSFHKIYWGFLWCCQLPLYPHERSLYNQRVIAQLIDSHPLYFWQCRYHMDWVRTSISNLFCYVLS